MKKFIFCTLLLLVGLSVYCGAEEKTKQPNFLIFFADDLGYGDLSYLSQNNTIRKPANTPHIDALARNGINFRAAYAAEAVCTPSRSALLTGRLPSRSGMASSDPDFRTMMSPAQKTGIPHVEYTMAEALKDQGYSTGLVGKWHLGIGASGEHLPSEHGFDYYYGMPVSNVQTCGGKTIYKESNSLIFAIVRLWNIWVSMLSIVIIARLVRIIGNKMFLFSLVFVFICILCAQWYINNITLCARMSCLLYKNKEIIEQPVVLQNLTLRLTHQAIQFIDRQTPETPWFLKMSYIKVHTALFTSNLFKNESGVGDFGDNVAELDWSIGKIMDALERNGFLENTLVVFSSDNGPYLERGEEAGNGGYVVTPNGEKYLKGGKGQNWEGGIRVPTIAYWAKHIPPKSVEQPISLMDFYPTFLKLAGHPGVTDRPIDGKDLTNLIFAKQGEQVETVHEYIFHWCGNTLHAARRHQYKLHWITPIWDEGTEHCDSVVICQCAGRRLEYHKFPLLYNIVEDPGEQNPIDHNSELYKNILNEFNQASIEHEKTFSPVTNQLESFPRPWIMPCCNPTGVDCSCHENNDDFEYLLSSDKTAGPSSTQTWFTVHHELL